MSQSSEGGNLKWLTKMQPRGGMLVLLKRADNETVGKRPAWVTGV